MFKKELAIFAGSIVLSGLTTYYYSNRGKSKLVYRSNQKDFSKLVEYIYKEYPDKINTFTYTDGLVNTFNQYRYRYQSNREEGATLKTMSPLSCNFMIDYEGSVIHIKIDSLKNIYGDDIKLLESSLGCTKEEFIRTIELSSDNREVLCEFKDKAHHQMSMIYEKHSKSSSDTMRVFYYKKDYWALLSKSPKRGLNTIYLKEGVRDELLSNISEFFDDQTREIYLKFGIPYKCVNLIHGPPGSGKTSIIKGLASELDCDLYVLPISKDMVDTNLVDAFSYINNNDDEEPKRKIIVIEDIDTLFDDRKQGDKDNGITLQAVLNCLDGFVCIEGTMLFLTANKPEILDYALMRSCRIDQKIELSYADKYQTQCMYDTFFPEQKERFNEFYNKIKHKEYTTAVLQEFLFYNRDCDDIIKEIGFFDNVLQNNDPKNFEEIKGENKNFYS